jgi:hypothetical protein
MASGSPGRKGLEDILAPKIQDTLADFPTHVIMKAQLPLLTILHVCHESRSVAWIIYRRTVHMWSVAVIKGVDLGLFV